MKRIIFLLITLTTIANVSYASFPVLENVQQDSVKYSEIATSSDPEDDIYSVLGFFVGLFSWVLILPLLFLFHPNKSFRTGIIAGFLTGALLLVIFIIVSLF